MVDSRIGAESIRWGEASTAAGLLHIPLDAFDGVLSDRPIIAVCAQGRHDECCAVRGRPVAGTLASRYPDETWECSHIGGDRFAATMILFPHALTFGRVDDGDPAQIVEEYRAGRIAIDRFRGRASLPRVVQAAQSAAFVSTGDRRITSHRPLALVERSGSWFVDLAGEPPVRVLVEGVQEPPLFTTCSATVQVTVAGFAASVTSEIPGGSHARRGARPVDSPVRTTGGASD